MNEQRFTFLIKKLYFEKELNYIEILELLDYINNLYDLSDILKGE